MAAGFLITRLFVVFLLSELDYSSAFPRGRSYVHPEAWQGLRRTQEGYGYGNRRPLQYIQALRQTHSKLQPNVRDQVQVRSWRKPQENSLNVRSHAQIQNQPIPYHQTQSQYEPWSAVATKWTHEMSPSEHPPQRNHPLSTPRAFEFSLKVPFAEELGQNKGTPWTIKGSDLNSGGSDVADQYSQLYRPTGVQIYSAFNSPPGPESFSGKGSTNYPTADKTAHEVSKLRFQLSLSVPIPPNTPSPKPSSSNGGHLANLQRPGRVGFDPNSYMELAKPQSSSTQSASERIFLNPSGTVQLQTQHQTHEPIQTEYTDNTMIRFSPAHASQHTTSTVQISQGQDPTKQSLVYPEPPAQCLPAPQYPPLQRADVYSGYYNTHTSPLSNGNRKGQSGQPVSPDPTNVHLSLTPAQYEQVPSGHYSAGQIKPSAINYGQHQTWQPAGAPLTFASEQSDVQVKPSFGQNVETLPDLSPGHPSCPTAAPSQYERPSFHQVATPNYYGTDNPVQMGPADFTFSSPYQYSRDLSGQDALPDHQTAVDPSSNLGLSTDYQTQIRLPSQYPGRGKVDGKPQYAKLYIDDTDVTDVQPNYSAATPAHYGDFPGTY
ncbi:uncharacterized protein [Pagrus major]|uniref:uncharacterized protein n=1 Tax=Pagrus major TaxID=143350 RepID=UPI003CC89E5C